MTFVRQSRATLDRGRANSRQGQQAGDADYLTSIGPPPGYVPTPTRLQERRQIISDARRAQLAGCHPSKIGEITVHTTTTGKHAATCPICGKTLTKDSRAGARSKIVDHIARDHRAA